MIAFAGGQRGAMAENKFSEAAFFFLLPFLDGLKQFHCWSVDVYFEWVLSLSTLEGPSVYCRLERHFPSSVVEIEFLPLGQSRLCRTTTGEDLQFDDFGWKRSFVGAVASPTCP